MIPILDLKLQYQNLKTEIDAAMQEVAESGSYVLGSHVKALEEQIAAYGDCKYGIGVANGTDALHLALRALRIGPGDEVITTPFTFIATTEAICAVGAKPVFVDINPDTFNLDPNLIEPAILQTPKSSCRYICMVNHATWIDRGVGQKTQAKSGGGLCSSHRGYIQRQKSRLFRRPRLFQFFPEQEFGLFWDAEW